jgi:hypothetical protein
VNCLSFSADRKALASGGWDNNAYTWDVDAIAREVGLEELLSNPYVSLIFLIIVMFCSLFVLRKWSRKKGTSPQG